MWSNLQPFVHFMKKWLRQEACWLFVLTGLQQWNSLRVLSYRNHITKEESGNWKALSLRFQPGRNPKRCSSSQEGQHNGLVKRSSGATQLRGQLLRRVTLEDKEEAVQKALTQVNVNALTGIVATHSWIQAAIKTVKDISLSRKRCTL
ncbi:uncharacterized protein LOC144115876 [Amblyomma americanum]